jgi:hypothetical protein
MDGTAQRVDHGPSIHARLDDGAAIVDYVCALPMEERPRATLAAQKALFAAAVDEPGLDLYTEVIRTLLARGKEALAELGDEAARRRYTDSYNALSYNFCADLCDCWPEDVLRRSERHFNAGLSAAEDCVRWRDELGKPPVARSRANWARGMHQLSLGRCSEALESFTAAQGLALEAQQADIQRSEAGVPTFDVLLCTGFLGIAEQLCGVSGGGEKVAQVIDAFKHQAESEDAQVRDEAQLGLGELGLVIDKYVIPALGRS